MDLLAWEKDNLLEPRASRSWQKREWLEGQGGGVAVIAGSGSGVNGISQEYISTVNR